MCGIFGWSLSEEARESIHLYTLAAVLAHTAERRGDESWGFCLNEGPQAQHTIPKNVGSIKQTCKISQVLVPQVIGHTRRATSGAVTVPNAHPFHIGDIIGVHNGYIFEHEENNRKYKRDYNVDSMHLIAHIAEAKPIKD